MVVLNFWSSPRRLPMQRVNRVRATYFWPPLIQPRFRQLLISFCFLQGHCMVEGAQLVLMLLAFSASKSGE
jgi:hypothetical protein